MKKFRVFLAFMLLCANFSTKGYCTTVSHEDPELLDFRIERTIDDNPGHPFPHSIVKKPQVEQDGHTLYIYSGCDNTTIELLDVNGQVVYTADVAEGTETLTLPESLTGTFELRIIRGSFTFVGEIDL